MRLRLVLTSGGSFLKEEYMGSPAPSVSSSVEAVSLKPGSFLKLDESKAQPFPKLDFDQSIRLSQALEQRLIRQLFFQIFKNEDFYNQVRKHLFSLDSTLCKDKEIISLLGLPGRHKRETSFSLLDILIDFTRSTIADKRRWFGVLMNKKNPQTRKDFAQDLRWLREELIKQLKRSMREFVDAGWFNRKREEVATLVTQRFIPLVLLVFSIEQHPLHAYIQHEGRWQVLAKSAEQEKKKEEILKAAKSPGGYYQFNYEPLFADENRVLAKLSETFAIQILTIYKIRHLLRSLQKVCSGCPELFNFEAYHHWFLDCLKDITQKYQSIENEISDNLTGLKDDFQKSAEGIVSDIQKLKRILQEKISVLSRIKTFDDQAFHHELMKVRLQPLQAIYQSALDKELNLHVFDDVSLATPHAEDEEVIEHSESLRIDYRGHRQLISLIASCRAQLSLLSYHGYKGQCLATLLREVENRPALTQAEAKIATLELARVVCAYRCEPYFFNYHANYAETSSAKCLIAAIIDSRGHYDQLELSKWLLDTDKLTLFAHRERAPKLVQDKLVYYAKKYGWESEDKDLAMPTLSLSKGAVYRQFMEEDETSLPGTPSSQGSMLSRGTFSV